MIQSAQITAQPISGKYPEHIYEAPLTTLSWTWVKFEDEHYNEFYGQFHGGPNCVAISTHNAVCYVLTNEFLYEIDRQNPANYQVRDFWDCGSTLTNVTFLPNGQALFSNYYEIFTINESFDDTTEIENPIHLDSIKFDDWEGNLLHIHANRFDDGQPRKLIFDAHTMRLTVNEP